MYYCLRFLLVVLEKTREQGTIQQQPHKEEDAEDAEVQVARQDEDKCKDNETYHSILEARNHKIRMEKKVTYPSGA